MLIAKWIYNGQGPLSNKDYVIITHFSENSFKKDGTYRDVFFGGLEDFFKQDNKTVITCGLLLCKLKNILNKIKDPKTENVFILEYFLTGTSLLKCLKITVNRLRNRNQMEISKNMDGENISGLLQIEIDNAFYSGQVFLNLSVYHSVKNLLKIIDTNKILFPFENRSWEKMIILAVKEKKKNIKLSGFQHASLTPIHINFLMEKGETETIPFPDEIISVGNVTKSLMVHFYNIPENIIKLGCALRQSEVRSQSKLYKNKVNGTIAKEETSLTKEKNNGRRYQNGCSLLVALASNLDEYVRTLKFLEKASLSRDYIIKIRAHPAIGFNEAISIYNPVKLHYIIDNRRLSDSIIDSDIIIYAHSTVGVQALSIGKPVIYLDFGNFINSDPLFGFSDFKWTCDHPEKLQHILKEIRLMDKNVMKEKQEKGILYSKEYFTAVNDENIRPFLAI